MVSETRVFLVEDDVIIRMTLVDMLTELGCRVVVEAGRIDEAIELARSSEFDLAILDLNLYGDISTPVAQIVKARDLPIIFSTGHSADGLPEEFRNCPLLQKPFEFKHLAAVIEEARS